MVERTETPDVTRSAEDYLKAILKLESDDRPVRTSAIAEALAIAPASVTGMLKRLSDIGLVRYERYRGAQLTETGRRVALTVVRRHRILESYLYRKLGFSWDSVHDEADRLEHVVSDALIERMALAMGNPCFDPHGDPIPTETGEIDAAASMALSEVAMGERAELTRVTDQNPERLRFLESLGLTPGVLVDVKDHQPFRGPVTVWVVTDQRERMIGHNVAETLRCRVVEEEA